MEWDEYHSLVFRTKDGEETVFIEQPDGSYLIKDSDLKLDASGLIKYYKFEEKYGTNGITILRDKLRLAQGHYAGNTEDVLKFLGKSNLPVTPKGRILGYKVLRNKDGKWVDTHTELVQQEPGDIVSMDRALVDPERTRHCSYGLHVCSAEYLLSFAADGLFLVVVDPRDIISVPEDTESKVRVCKYKVLQQIPDEVYQELKRTKDTNDQVLTSIVSFWLEHADDCSYLREVQLLKPCVEESKDINVAYGDPITVFPKWEGDIPDSYKKVILEDEPEEEDIYPDENEDLWHIQCQVWNDPESLFEEDNLWLVKDLLEHDYTFKDMGITDEDLINRLIRKLMD